MAYYLSIICYEYHIAYNFIKFDCILSFAWIIIYLICLYFIICIDTYHNCSWTHNCYIAIISCYKYGVKFLAMNIHRCFFFKSSYSIGLLIIANPNH